MERQPDRNQGSEKGGRMNIRKFKRLAIKSLEINPKEEE